MSRSRWKKLLRITGLAIIGLLVVAQVIPYGRDHANPTVIAEPPWDTAATRTLARRACFDCHSNATQWPWYSNVAPMSWLVQQHVDEGRRELNFSTWTRDESEAEEASEAVRTGEMPPWSYLILHPEAKLDDAERAQLAAGLDATLGPPRSTQRD